MDKLYIQPYPGLSMDSAKDVIHSLFENENQTNRIYARPTYIDEECSKIEYPAGRRSFEDLLTIARTYFPSTTEVELLKILKDLNLGFNYCSDIHKLVFYRTAAYLVTEYSLRIWSPRKNWAKGTYTAEKLLEIYNGVL